MQILRILSKIKYMCSSVRYSEHVFPKLPKIFLSTRMNIVNTFETLGILSYSFNNVQLCSQLLYEYHLSKSTNVICIFTLFEASYNSSLVIQFVSSASFLSINYQFSSPAPPILLQIWFLSATSTLLSPLNIILDCSSFLFIP